VLVDAGLQYLAAHHSDTAYLAALDALLGRSASPEEATLSEPRRPAAPVLRAR
jgi:hypothetical protein